jgi:hypothetical protein
MAQRYRCLHSVGFQVMLINPVCGTSSIECGIVRLPAGIGDRTPWLFDFDTGKKVCRVRIPEEDRSSANPMLYHSRNDDLSLEIYYD